MLEGSQRHLSTQKQLYKIYDIFIDNIDIKEYNETFLIWILIFNYFCHFFGYIRLRMQMTENYQSIKIILSLKITYF